MAQSTRIKLILPGESKTDFFKYVALDSYPNIFTKDRQFIFYNRGFETSGGMVVIKRAND